MFKSNFLDITSQNSNYTDNGVNIQIAVLYRDFYKKNPLIELVLGERISTWLYNSAIEPAAKYKQNATNQAD